MAPRTAGSPFEAPRHDLEPRGEGHYHRQGDQRIEHLAGHHGPDDPVSGNGVDRTSVAAQGIDQLTEVVFPQRSHSRLVGCQYRQRPCGGRRMRHRDPLGSELFKGSMCHPGTVRPPCPHRVPH